jgi:hypothetical protein
MARSTARDADPDTSSAPALAADDGDLTADSDVEPVSGGKVHVPQADGEIVFTRQGESRTVKVIDHLVSPRTNVERAELLQLVEGAKLVD